MDGTILAIFIYLLWFVEVFFLYILFVLFLWEDFYFSRLFEDTRLFIMLFVSIIVFIIAFFIGSPIAGIIALLALLALPFSTTSMDMAESELKEKRISKDNEEIRNILKRLEKEGDDAGLYMRLGYLYRDLGDIKNALESFKKARELTGEAVLTVTEREIKSLENTINEKERKKTHICKHCGTKNYPTRIFCEKCKRLLGTSVVEYFRRLFKNTKRAAPFVFILVLILIVNDFLFGLILGLFEAIVYYGLLFGNIFMFIKKAIQAKYAYR